MKDVRSVTWMAMDLLMSLRVAIGILPDFIPRPLRTIEDWNGYIQSNGDFLWDMNQDGRLDVVAGSFLPSEVHWYENPSDEVKRLGQTWPKHLLMDTKQSQNEAQLLTDVDGDGRPEWVVNSWNNKNPVLIWRLVPTEDKLPGGSKFTLQSAEIATTGNRHGMGVGDINGDGKKDLLTGAGWYEQPASNPWGQAGNTMPTGRFKRVFPCWFTMSMVMAKADILVGEGHNYGLFWWRQTGKDADGKIEFDKRMIDKSYSQPHALALTDLNGDGRPELISGKRYFAHNGGDPGGKDMPLIVAYEFQPATQTYSRMVLEEGHVGIGLQIATVTWMETNKPTLRSQGRVALIFYSILESSSCRFKKRSNKSMLGFVRWESDIFPN